MAKEDYGEKIPYDALWKGPMEERRSRTDFRFLISLIVFVVFWIMISAYAQSTANNLSSNHRRLRRAAGDPLTFDEIKEELENAGFQYSLLKSVVAALLLSLAYIFLLRWFAKIIVWTMIILFCFMLFIGIIAMSSMYANSSNNSGYLYSIILLVIVFVVTVICAIAFRKKIAIACEVIREASKSAIFFPSLFFLPIPTLILYLISIVFSGFNVINLSIISSTYKETPLYIQFFHFYNIFGFLWLINFVTGVGQMIMSGSFATWYWTMNKKYVPRNAVSHSIITTTRYHMGTIAFGSMIITICQVINAILNSLKSRSQGNCSSIGNCLCSWYTSMFETIVRFIKYINRNAYIMSAVHGTDFFTSAKNAFNLIMRNVVKVLVTTRVSNLILFLGQAIAIGLTWLFIYLTSDKIMNNEVQSYFIIAILLIAFLISTACFSVLQTAIDTVFICALEDYERNDGSEERPYYMSYKLQQLLLE